MEAQRACDMIFWCSCSSRGYFAAWCQGEVWWAAAAPGIDPNVKSTVDTFVQWIKDPNGFPAYIKYYLDMNDPNMLAQLANVYEQFKRVFGF